MKGQTMKRGRPPCTRNRVLGYIEKHKPATVMQIVRATGADRARVYRILWAEYGSNFRELWPAEKSEPHEFRNMAEPLLAA